MANPESNSIIANPNDYERLVRFVTREGADFALCLVQYRDPSIRDKIIDKLEFDAKQLGVLVKTLDFGELDHNANLLEEMQKGLIQENTKVKALSIKRLDLAIVDAMGNPRIAPSIQGLNLARDQIPKAVPARVVLWLNEAACNALATSTTDFYDVIYSFYQFDDQEPQSMITSYLEIPWWMHFALEKDITRLEREALLLQNTFNSGNSRSTKADAAARIGQIAMLTGKLDDGLMWLEKSLELFQSTNQKFDETMLQLRIGDYYFLRRDLVKAKNYFEVVQKQALESENLPTLAVAQSKLVDVLIAQGKLDEAIITLEEQILPLFQKLGNVREIAITHGKISDILFTRGKLDDAFMILEAQVLPAFQELNELQLVAVTQGKIVDIFEAQGKLDEAFTILENQILPVFQELGDVRGVAVTYGHIADILVARGKLDEALLSREKYELPIFEKIGDFREITVTQGKISDIYWRQGLRSKSIDLIRDTVLPAFEKLGDRLLLIVAQASLASRLLVQANTYDRAEAKSLLLKAFFAASEMQVPQANQIYNMFIKAFPNESTSITNQV